MSACHLYRPPHRATGIEAVSATWPPRQPNLHTGQPKGPPVSVILAALAAACCLASPAFCQNPNAPVEQQTQQGATTPAGTNVQSTVDKSRFTLFNPTPDVDMRPFCPDRPGKTHCAQTVDAGHLEVEGDLWNYTWDRYSTDQTTTRTYTVIDPNLKVGLTNSTEFDIFIPIHQSLDARSRNGGGRQTANGFGDILVGGKANFFGNDRGSQALGAIGFVKIPTAAANLGNNMAEFYLNVPFTTALPAQFSMTIEPVFNLIRNLNKQGYQGDPQLLVSVSHPLIGTLAATVDIASDFPADHNIGRRYTLDPALQWLITPNLQLDAGAFIGLNRAAPDWNPYAGISFRY